MLVDFTVSNYRSIREAVTLSAVAATRGAGTRRAAGVRSYVTDDEIAEPFVVEGRGFSVLPALGLFGANASGKSNVLRAIKALDDSLWEFGDVSSLQPFKLGSPLDEPQPTTLEMVVLWDEHLYRYRLSVLEGMVEQEELAVRPPPPGRERLVFSRAWDGTLQDYIIAVPARPGSRSLREQVEQADSAGTAISTIEGCPAVDSLRKWSLGLSWSCTPETLSHDMEVTKRHAVAEPEALLTRMGTLLAALDTGVGRLDLGTTDDWSLIKAIHDTPWGPVTWDIGEESTGTQRLFALARPIIQARDAGGVVIVDELDSSLHPHIVHTLIRLFHDRGFNPRGAQLIFSSHDATLLGADSLRRDQTWFTQRRPDGSTDLFCLSDFRVRQDLARERAYLDGRFGAVPVLPDESELLGLVSPAR